MPEIERPLLLHKRLDTLSGLVPKFYDLTIHNEDHLRAIADFQAQAQSKLGHHIPMYFLFNHISMDDPHLMIHLVHSHLSDQIDNIIVPVGDRHIDMIRSPHLALPIQFGTRLTGIQAPALTQGYRERAEGLSQLEREKMDTKKKKLNRSFLEIAKKISKKGSCFIIAPEGHRSPKGWGLLPAEDGIGFMVEMMKDCLVVPVGINYKGDYSRGLNIHPRQALKGDRTVVDMVIGMPLTKAQVKETAIARAEEIGLGMKQSRSWMARLQTHAIMFELADLLPPYMHGVYTYRYNLRALMKGQLYSALDSKGKFIVRGLSQK